MSIHDRLAAAGQGGILSRRGFLIGATLAGAAFQVGLVAPRAARAAGIFAPNAFIRIPPEGKIALVMPSVEMGQGVYTAVAMLIAEELEVPLDAVTLEHAPADPAYANPILGAQITGGSFAIRGVYEPMRKAGAAAREMLVAAAARGWGVDPATCRAEGGAVRHPPSGRSAPYGVLAEAAAAEPVPQDPALKPAAEFRLIGTPARRLDSPSKIDGSALFGIDARPPGLKYAAIALCPHFGGALASVDPAPALAVKGVTQVVTTGDSVAVVAAHTGAARKGLAALDIAWTDGGAGGLDTAELERRMEAAIERPGLPYLALGDVAAAEAANAPALDFVYRQSILPHTTMEPMNCTVHIRPDGAEVWTGSQVMGRAQAAVAETAGLPEASVVVRNHLLGGGFGRRLDVDGVIAATRIAMQVDGPVKVTWSREEDVRHDCYRYYNHSKVTVTVGPDGLPRSWRHRVVGPSVMARWLPAFTKDGVDLDSMDAAESPYDIPAKATEFSREEAPDGMLTGNWRGVGPTRNAPAVEGVIDELAHRAGADPVAYRRRLLAGKPRLAAALDLAASRAGWGEALPPGRGRGVAAMEAFGSFAAMVIEVTVAPSGGLSIDRVTCAVDCGQAINPDTVDAQIQSGVIYGLSAALHGRITVANGAVVEGNFDDAPVLRMHEAPRIDVHIVASAEPPGGIGEVGTPPVAPALFNAIFAATGKRLRSLPIDAARLGSA